MSANVIESFFVALGFEIDTKELDEFSSKIEEAKDTVLKISTVAGLAAAAVGAFITKVGYGIDDLGDFAEAEQVSVEALQEIGYAAQLSGSDLNAVKASISAVNKTVGEAVLGIGRGAMTFDKLGMSAKNADGSVKSFDQILEEVSDKMDGMSRQEAIAMAEKLGIDRSLIPMLLKGREHIARLREEARAFGIVTEQDAEKASQFADSMDRTRFMLSGLADQVGLNLMPAMTGMLDGMRKWLFANREVIKSAITKYVQYLTAVLGTFWDWVIRSADALSGLVKWLTTSNGGLFVMATTLALITKYAAYKTFGMVAEGVKLVAKAFTVANAAALVTSAVIGGIVIALALLIDDYVNWKEGNDSVIGDLMKQFPWLLDMFNSIQNAVGAMVDFWVEQWRTIGPPLMDLFSSLWKLASVIAQILWPVIKTVFEGWGYILALVLPLVSTLVGWIAESLVGAITHAIGFLAKATEMVTSFVNSVLGAITKVGELLGLTSDASNVKVAVGAAGNGAQASTANNTVNAKGGVIGTAGSNSTSTSTVTQTTQISAPITIRSTDPVAAAKEVGKEMERMNRQATRNGQSAVAL